ncbi:MAG: iron chelate uptake ABC transporter family permease subunit [Duganella sp.]
MTIDVSPKLRLTLLATLALALIATFLMIGANGNWDFVLPFRGAKLAAMVLVAYAIAVSSVLFQSITHNRILTPSIMGFDALYLLIQAVIIFGLGSDPANGPAHPGLRFAVEVVLMTGFACLLFRTLFTGAAHSLHLMLLAGIVFGLLFRSLSSLVVRLIDPNEFMILQDRMFASFNAIQTELLSVAALAIVLASLLAWRLRHQYDVLSLGREVAINLGIHYRRTVMLTLALIAVMVSVATALVGPVTFFGLLVSNLAYVTAGSDRHKYLLPMAVLWGVVFLVGGQLLLERVLEFNATVSVVIEFVGGLLFLFLITRKQS